MKGAGQADERQDVLRHAEAIRREFDDAFARPRDARREARARLVCVRAGDTALALEIDALGGLARDRTVVAPPLGPPGLLGIAGLRGRLVAVYDLAALLGLEPPEAPPTWFAVCAADPSVGLAFSAFDGYAEVSRGDLLGPAGNEDTAHPEVHHEVVAAGARRGVVDVEGVLNTVRKRVDGTREGTEDG